MMSYTEPLHPVRVDPLRIGFPYALQTTVHVSFESHPQVPLPHMWFISLNESTTNRRLLIYPLLSAPSPKPHHLHLGVDALGTSTIESTAQRDKYADSNAGGHTPVYPNTYDT